MSSMCSAVRANRSLTSMPLWPYFLNLNGEGNAAPVLRSVVSVSGSGWPAYFCRAGLGSNVSTCDGPAVQKEMNDPLRFAREMKRARRIDAGHAGRRGDRTADD